MLLDLAAGCVGDRLVFAGETLGMNLRVSVVVPTYRRPELLGRCLAALTAQTMVPDSYEVLVADDAASAETRRQVEEYSKKAAFSIRYLPVTRIHGPAAARNIGWRAARAPIIAFTDDDTVPDAGWLAAGAGALERDCELAAVTGQVIVPLPPLPTDYQRNEAGLETAAFVTANCFCRRGIMVILDGFEERFMSAWRDDSDLHFRLLEHGFKLRKEPEAIVVHLVRPASWGVSLRMQRKSQFDALLCKKHPDLYRKHIQRWPPLDYYGIVLSAAVAFLTAALGMWIACVVTAFMWTWLMGCFLQRRLRGNSRHPTHVLGMLITSLLIPFLSIFWRLYGAAKFRVWFW
jgi:glycosyltransferase involved in cell wall biosynthesis